MKRPTPGKDAGFVEDSRGFVAAHGLRKRYHQAGKDLRKAKQALGLGTLDTERAALREKDLCRAQREFEACEVAVRNSWAD